MPRHVYGKHIFSSPFISITEYVQYPTECASHVFPKVIRCIVQILSFMTLKLLFMTCSEKMIINMI